MFSRAVETKETAPRLRIEKIEKTEKMAGECPAESPECSMPMGVN
jgi:hypothetical protein